MKSLPASLKAGTALPMFLRFVVVGAANTLLSLVVYWVGLMWMPPQIAYAVSFAAGVVTGYLLHTRYAFRSRRGWRSFLAWPLVCLAGWAAGASALQLAIGPLGIDPRIAPRGGVGPGRPPAVCPGTAGPQAQPAWTVMSVQQMP